MFRTYKALATVKNFTFTVYFTIFLAAIILAFEIIMLMKGQPTISQLVWKEEHKHSLAGVCIGILLGALTDHFAFGDASDKPYWYFVLGGFAFGAIALHLAGAGSGNG